jgi:hypothetical protein
MPTCPICNKQFSARTINSHVNSCLETSEGGGDPARGGDLRERMYDQPTVTRGRRASDKHLQHLVNQSLTVEGFLELLARTNGNRVRENVLDVGGILQVCVHGLETADGTGSPSAISTHQNILTPNSVVVHFDGEDFVVPLTSRQTNGTPLFANAKPTAWATPATKPHTISFIVQKYYGPSQISFVCGQSKKKKMSIAARFCCGGNSNNGNPVTGTTTPQITTGCRVPTASITLNQLNNPEFMFKGKTVLLPVYMPCNDDEENPCQRDKKEMFRVRVWLRFVPGENIGNDQATALLQRCVYAGDTTSVGLFCRMKAISLHVRKIGVI